MKQEGIGTGVWVENFGDIEISFFYEEDIDNVDVSLEKCYYVNKNVLRAMDRIYEMIKEEQGKNDND